METLRSWPYPLTVAALFVIVLVRANATYWVGRGARSGADRTRLHPLVSSPGFLRAERLLERWGAPLVTACFLTVGVQTVVNLAAGATRMSLRRYLPAVALGSAVWAVLYATVGFATFSAWQRLYQLSPAAAVVVVAVLVLALVGFVTRQLRHRTAVPGQAAPTRAEACAVTGGPEGGPTSG